MKTEVRGRKSEVGIAAADLLRMLILTSDI
jgi:hypothetical protein